MGVSRKRSSGGVRAQPGPRACRMRGHPQPRQLVAPYPGNAMIFSSCRVPPEAEAPIRPTPSPDRADDHAHAEQARRVGERSSAPTPTFAFIPVCCPDAADPLEFVATGRCFDRLDAVAHRCDLGRADGDFRPAGRGRAVKIVQSQRCLAKSWSWLASLPITVGLRWLQCSRPLTRGFSGQPSRPQGWKISEWSCGQRRSGTRMWRRSERSYLALTVVVWEMTAGGL